MEIIEPVGKIEHLAPNPTPTEADLQFKLASAITSAGLLVNLEYSAPHCRFDLVVFDDQDNALAIIEVKRGEYTIGSGKHRKVYSSFGLPVYLVKGESDVNEFINNHLHSLKERFTRLYANKPLAKSKQYDSYLAYRKQRREERKRYRIKLDPDLNIKYVKPY